VISPWLLLVFGIGLLLRLALVQLPGYTPDVSLFVAWAERLSTRGPAEFYHGPADADAYAYLPGFLYVLWGLGTLFDGEALRIAIKALSVPFDVAIAVVAAYIAGGLRARGWAVGLWMLSPGVIVAGALWGQVDALGGLPILIALVLAGRARWAPAGVLTAIAFMVKPQFGAVGIVVLAAAAVQSLHARHPGPVVRCTVAGAATSLAIAIPFGLTPLDAIGLLRDAAGTFPAASLNAFNVWAIIAGFGASDGPYVLPATALVTIAFVLSLLPLWWRRDTAALLASGAVAALALYFLPTRVHERYLLPALVILLPLAASRPRLLAPYLALQLGFLLSLALAFGQHELVGAPIEIELVRQVLLARPLQIGVAVLMLAAAGLIIVRLRRGDAALVSDDTAARASLESRTTEEKLFPE
jgi:hypothetical protein